MEQTDTRRHKSHNFLYIGIVIVVLVIAASVFWVVGRPAMIRSDCNKSALAKAQNPDGFLAKPYYADLYYQCMEAHGKTPTEKYGVPLPSH